MRTRILAGVACAIALSFVAPSIAEAQPDPDKLEERRKKRDEAREERDKRREDRKEKRDEVINKRREAVDAYLGGATPEELKKKHEELVAARKDLQKARQDARKAEKERVKALLEAAGVDVNKAAVTAELRLHSYRVARLARIRELAVAAGDEALQQRVDQLAAKEDARHKARMAKLTGGEGATP